MENNKRVNSLKKTNKPKFEEGKSYQWDPATEFVVVGPEFATLYNVLQKLVKNPMGSGIPASMADLVDCYSIMHKIFVAGVEEGAIVEMKAKDYLLQEALEEGGKSD